MSPQSIEESTTAEEVPMQQTNGTGTSLLDPQRLLRADVRKMSRSEMRWYMAASAVAGIAVYLLRLPLRRRPVSWPRLVVDLAANAALPAAGVWFIRWLEQLRMEYESDPNWAARDYANPFRQQAGHRGNESDHQAGEPAV
jgi:hypothetical protein